MKSQQTTHSVLVVAIQSTERLARYAPATPRSVVRESKALSSSPEVKDFRLAARILLILANPENIRVSGDSKVPASSRLGLWKRLSRQRPIVRAAEAFEVVIALPGAALRSGCP
ncbi:hypothetical protein GJ633_10490 [Halorubrum sp. CBA1125]|uniref:hypothetical protein n=1 Tax=Halorubrum sp. CBA1125 TaxID=2668072 RepID=UPI0012E7D98B|nr:hypothetical protein [Halorubrum sp. CBA1125]MUW15041.1 hypothetical protein [Halorubrum sp. CBA1125]